MENQKNKVVKYLLYSVIALLILFDAISLCCGIAFIFTILPHLLNATTIALDYIHSTNEIFIITNIGELFIGLVPLWVTLGSFVLLFLFHIKCFGILNIIKRKWKV